MKNMLSCFSKRNYQQTLWIGSCVLFLIQWLRRFIPTIVPESFDYSGWGGPSDWYVNYQDGFIRRGLTGEILYFFAKHFSVNVEWIITITCLVCFCILCFFFIKYFHRKRYALYILLMSFFLGSFHSHNKDHLMMCIFILNLLVYRSNLNMTVKFFMINTSAAFMILSHEAFGIIALPALFILLFGRYKSTHEGKNRLKPVVSSFLFLLPSIFAFLLTLYSHGNPEIAQTIWDSWMFPGKVPEYSAIGALGWTTEFAFNFHTKLNFLTISYGVPSLLGWSITLCVVYYMLINYLSFFRKDGKNYTNEHRSTLSVILLFQFVCMLPLFIGLSCDYGRLFVYWTESSFVLFLLIPQNDIQGLTPCFLNKVANNLNDKFLSLIPPSRTLLVFLMLFFGISGTEFSMGAILKSSMVYNIFELVKDSILFMYGCVF